MKAILSLMVELLEMVNVNVGHNSSFQMGNAYNQVNYPLGISGRKPQPKSAVGKSSENDSCA